MGEVSIDTQVRKNCWNLLDSYGEICVGCGCCSKDMAVRVPARLECLRRWMKDREDFNDWAYEDSGLMAYQKKVVLKDIAYYRKMIRYYEGQMKLIEERKRHGSAE